VEQGRRRLAVTDEAGRLLGLLCLKKDGTGYCSDDGIRERAAERTGRDHHAPLVPSPAIDRNGLRASRSETCANPLARHSVVV
jgi:hypothetical protein